jgi:hypothetical protein
LKESKGYSTRGALISILARSDNVKPRSILLDNGSEFSGLFKTYCKAHNIKLRHIVSHTPQANGIAERVNKEVRRLLKQLHVRNNNTIWFDKFEEVERTKNTTYHGTIKATPETVWNARALVNHAPGDVLNSANVNKRTLGNIVDTAKKRVNRFNQTEFKVGDIVRCEMGVIFSDIRKMIKAGNGKFIAVFYAPRMFRVHKVIEKNNPGLERNEYLLQDVEHPEYMLAHKKSGNAARVFGTNLVKTSLKDTIDMTEEDALDLNLSKSSSADLALR